MNKRKLGKKHEKEVKKWLEGLGYDVWLPPNTRWQSNDIFYLFDLIGIATRKTTLEYTYQYGYMPFIQVKTNRTDFYKARKQIKEWVENHDLLFYDVKFGVLLYPNRLWLYPTEEFEVEV